MPGSPPQPADLPHRRDMLAMQHKSTIKTPVALAACSADTTTGSPYLMPGAKRRRGPDVQASHRCSSHSVPCREMPLSHATTHRARCLSQVTHIISLQRTTQKLAWWWFDCGSRCKGSARGDLGRLRVETHSFQHCVWILLQWHFNWRGLYTSLDAQSRSLF